MYRRFAKGQVIIHREVLDNRSWLAYPVRTVVDEPDMLVTYLAHGSPLTFGAGSFTWGPHPWRLIGNMWLSSSTIRILRPTDGYAVCLVWDSGGGPFLGWYINFQEPYRRTAQGIDTLDQTLDIWAPNDGSPPAWKDLDEFNLHVDEGRFAPRLADRIRGEANVVFRMLETGTCWWDTSWTGWEAPPDWGLPEAVDVASYDRIVPPTGEGQPRGLADRTTLVNGRWTE